MSSDHTPLTLETAINWARSGLESDKVYRFLFLHPDDFFTIPQGRSWSIAHQIVYHGDIDLLKRILVLFSDDQINIRTLSNDKKTLLDVAKDRQKTYSTMYTYIEHLFLQDELINAAKDSNWRSVSDILEKHPNLINEKPPYSSYFLLHYIVQNGSKDILEDLLQRYPFQTNVLSADNETPADMAKRLKKADMHLILQPTTRDQSDSNLIKRRSSSPPASQNNKLFNEKLTYPTTTTSSPVKSSSSSMPPSFVPPYPTGPSSFTPPYPTGPTSFSLSYPPINSSLIGFGNILLDLNESGKFTVESPSLSTIIQIEPSTPKQDQQTSTPTKPNNTTKPIVNQNLEINSESIPTTPVSQSSRVQLMRNLTCSLTQQIFADPVIATDGQTYERKAITEWINLYHCSPTTGAPMEAKFKDNTELKQIIQSMTT